VVGASGFVGRNLCVALNAAKYVVRRGTSNRTRAGTGEPDCSWTFIDMNDPDTHGKALDGCRSVVYLFHALGSGPDYAQREARAAAQFRAAASQSRLEKIVYLGGVAPLQSSSQHLESRRATGQLLRGSDVTTVELRAAMIIGKGSTSFNLVRDLAVRSPWLALPTWLDQGSCPVAIDDVVYAIVRALDLDLPEPCCFDLPGPEWLTHRALLERLSALVGTKILARPLPWISTRVAAKLLGLITRERASVVSELVAGLPSDLTPAGQNFWNVIGEAPACSVMSAILNALADETSLLDPSVATRERLVTRISARPQP
jgi:uncharacterized protein YbjT (DUF2867 family)